MSKSCLAARAGATLAAVACLAGCGTDARGGGTASVSADVDPPAPSAHHQARATTPAAPARVLRASCAASAMQALRDVATRVYREGVLSERTAVAEHAITASAPLREAVRRGDSAGAQAAAQALIAAGRMTDLRVSRAAGGGGATQGGPAGGGPVGGGGSGEVLADVGPPALAPIGGMLTGAGGAPIGSFLTSVWSDQGFIVETEGITQGLASLRQADQSLPGSFALAAGPLPSSGTMSLRSIAYRYTSFPVTAYPSGPLRVYLLRTDRSLSPLCGASGQDTLVNTLARVANLLYDSEGGLHAAEQVHRVQHDRALLSAVARRDPLAARNAVQSLLNQHVVRLRVSAGGRLLADVGGPYVLAPVSAPLRLGGRQIGSLVLSVQDDEGYKRLAGRLVGLRVLMYMGSQLVKNSLGPAPAAPPAQGRYVYQGQRFRVFTIHAQAFPSGPLRIVVLMPIPYS